jgi:SSS family solute:Na+ symporter
LTFDIIPDKIVYRVMSGTGHPDPKPVWMAFFVTFGRRVVMDYRILIILVYLLLTLVMGVTFRKRSKANKVEFFLAGRSVTKLLLFFTMAATNFSAFTIFGFSGAGYRIGYSFYPVMGFGTGFMALSFHVIGAKILRLSREHNYITPSDFIFDRYRSRFLKKLFSLVMVVFTLPYLSIQAIASGKSLQSLIGIPYLTGALLITGFVVTYVALGGLRSIIWTDFVQGLMMVLFTLCAFVIFSRRGGGFVAIQGRVFSESPDLFSRPGMGGAMPYGVWFGYLFLWFFADPMFPQLFQRFMVARDEKTLESTIVLYPIITTFLFFLTVSIGVMGRGTFPDLSRQATDTIFPLLLGEYTSVLFGTVLITGSIAALMSTMDSQLLTLTSMITNDFFSIRKNEILKEKATIIVLGGLGFLIAIRPPQTILEFISKTTFNGLAVLAPAVIGGLYWRGANRHGAIASIIAGEAMVLAYYLEVIHTEFILPVVPIVSVSGAVLVLVSLTTSSGGENHSVVFGLERSALPWIPVFAALFILGNDFWNWGRRPYIIGGLPLWVWYFFGLGVLLSAVFWLYFNRKKAR